MEAYPSEYVDHNLPFIVLSGLGPEASEDIPPSHQSLQEGGNTVDGHLPAVTGARADSLLKGFLANDGRRAAWNGRAAQARSGLHGFRVRLVGREYVFPARKASPPAGFRATDTTSPNQSSPREPSLHSPISPLSLASTIYPDGIMTPLWIAKHQLYIPSAFVSFFTFTSDPNLNSLNDNQLKSEINQVKAMLFKSGYRTRYAVVLLSDKNISEAPDIEERLATIRRATGLDPKTSLFFLPPNISEVELSTFVQSTLQSLQTVCVAYYRDLTKHARRKKARGTIPPPTAPPTKGTSQTLSFQGWHIRSEFKLGIFAEFRQEMDAAYRHFNTAQELLLAADGVFETTPSWAPRWDEARLLADSIAVRIIRCLLWNEFTTTAVQYWLHYRERMRAIVDRRGKGTSSYGWAAWESRWAKLMSELVQRAAVSALQPAKPDPNTSDRVSSIYALPEKTIPIGERHIPWTLLHHPGYWLHLAAGQAVTRRLLAEEIPEEDRSLPSGTPTSSSANRWRAYDTYLCPQPHIEYPLPGNEGFNHSNDIVVKYKESIREFTRYGQSRFQSRVQLDIGKELIDAGRFDEALDVLKPLWANVRWRRERWWPLLSEVTAALHQCALQIGDAETVLYTEWELLHRDLGCRHGHKYDLMRCLDTLGLSDSSLSDKPQVRLQAGEVASFLSVNCSFATRQGNVGEPLLGQITITSMAHKESRPVTLSNVVIAFDGPLKEISISHQQSSSPADQHSGSKVDLVALEENINSPGPRMSFAQSAHLEIHPGQTRVFEFSIVLREDGALRPKSSRVSIHTDKFDLSSDSPIESKSVSTWWLQGPRGLRPKPLIREKDESVMILPKPPKLELRILRPREQYYTDEQVTLEIESTNGEDDEIDIAQKVQITDSAGHDQAFQWSHNPELPRGISKFGDGGILHATGRLKPRAKRSETLTFQALSIQSECVVSINAIYYLVADPDTPVTKTLTFELTFVSPFEANYDFQPRLHKETWPSFFTMNEDDTDPPRAGVSVDGRGISQNWSLAARVVSFAEETLVIENMRLKLTGASGGVDCHVANENPSEPRNKEIAPRGSDERSFLMSVQKISLDDKRSSALNLALEVSWRRPKEQSAAVRTDLAVPRLVIPSSEPRVLATSYKSLAVASLIHLHYTIENPTMHFLTFDLTMEASDEFAFSGRKYGAVQVLPMSRQIIRYNVFPFVRATWIFPQLRVVDRYFNKNLRVLAADGVRSDKKGIAVWVVGDEIEE